MTKFGWCMIIPPPMMAQTTIPELNSDLHNAYVQIAPRKNQWQKLKKLFTIIWLIQMQSNCSQNAKFSGDDA